MFAPTSRHGNSEDLKALIEACHEADIGVLIDWVPGHFPSDDHGLARFDGTALYEYEDPREGFHPDWNTYIYNYASAQVQNFLRASALHWIDRYHIDGIRVDAVASMLYRNYSRNDGEWIPNIHGGHENLEAIEFLKGFNEELYATHPGVFSVAEESTAWPKVSKPTHEGGLGFGFKWNMGWMNDVLEFFSKDPVYRKYDMNKLTFGMMYAWSENFILVLSHDEVVHGKRSLLNKMPGDEWQKFANLRLLLGYMYSQPGKKLLFMGGDIGQQIEWNHDQGLDWHLLDFKSHHGINHYMRDLLQLYRRNPSMYELDCNSEGFEWIDFHDAENTIISYQRKTKNPADTLLFIFNFTPVNRENYRVGVPFSGRYEEILNSDSAFYGGSNVGNPGVRFAGQSWTQGQPHYLDLTIPPLGMIVMRPLDAPKMLEVGADKKLLKVYQMPPGIEVPKPKKKPIKKKASSNKKSASVKDPKD